MKKFFIALLAAAALTLLAACGTTSENTAEPFTVFVVAQGGGWVDCVEEGKEPDFSSPADSYTLTTDRVGNYVIAAQAEDGWSFVKWTKNDTDFSTESRVTVEMNAKAVYTAVFEKEETGLRIITQPLPELSVSVPDGFELYVGVSNPDLVASYQWQLNNGTHDNPFWVDLDCSSGRTESLFKPATVSDQKDREYRCVITSADGETIVSDVCNVVLENSRQYVSCIWFSEYAVLPGQTLDLSSVGLGSGTVSLNEKGDEATLADICTDNADPVYDYYDSNVGLNVLFYSYPYETFTVHVAGENVFTNTYWQESENAGGIPFCFNFLQDSKCTDVIFDGDGSLTVTGGTHMIYANARVTVGCDMNFGKIGTRYTTGIYAYEIEVLENVCIDANLNGFLFQTKTPEEHTDVLSGIIKINKGAIINAVCSAPVISVGSTDFHVISGMNGCVIDGAELNMIIQTSGKRFDEKHGVAQVVAIQTHFGDIVISDDAYVSAEFRASASESGHDYVFNGGIFVAEEGNVTVSGSRVVADANAPWMWNFAGVYAADVTFEDSIVDIDITARGNVLGFSMQGKLTLRSSALYVDAITYTEIEERQSFGIIAMALDMDDSYIKANATDVAIAIYVGAGDTERTYEEDYTPIVFADAKLQDRTPNVWSMPGAEHDFVYFETPYEGQTIPANFAYIEK